MRYKLLLIAATFAGTFTSLPASADPILFQLSGSRNATFIIDSDLTPNFVSSSVFGDQISYDNIAGAYGGAPSTATIGFGNDLFAELNIGNSNLGFTQFAGPDFFKLVNSKPVFEYGTFSLTSIVSGASTLQISAVSAAPEPAAWAMMMVGFGLIGGAIRYRRRKTNLTFA